MKISVVIPNWNGAEKLRKNLPQVIKIKLVDEVIVSDDGSTDNSLEILEKEFPQIKVVKRSKQGGFSTNVNFGVSNAIGDLILLLNSDAVAEVDCLEKVLPHFKDGNVFSVGCNVGGSWSWAKWHDGFFWHYMNEKKEDNAHQTLWGSGGSMIFRKKVWDELEGFDESFNPFYEEDVDLGYRATKRGYINIFEPKARVEHYKEPGVISQNYTKAAIQKTAQRNQLIFIWKNITEPDLIWQHIFGLIKMLLSHPKYWLIFLSALVYLPATLKKRKVEQSKDKLSDKKILSLF